MSWAALTGESPAQRSKTTAPQQAATRARAPAPTAAAARRSPAAPVSFLPRLDEGRRIRPSASQAVLAAPTAPITLPVIHAPREARFTSSFAPPDADTVAERRAKAQEQRRLVAENIARQASERQERQAEAQRRKAAKRHRAASTVQSHVRGLADRKEVEVRGGAQTCSRAAPCAPGRHSRALVPAADQATRGRGGAREADARTRGGDDPEQSARQA